MQPNQILQGIWEVETGPCPHKQNEKSTCTGYPANGPIICNMISMDQVQECDKYYRMCELRDHYPQLWTKEVCCEEWRYMMLRCAEAGGSLSGACDLRVYPNDGKDVWRNYYRVWFRHCPFCGQKVHRLDEIERETS
jgi:hypothetical protein